jgi:hypothetical protein
MSSHLLTAGIFGLGFLSGYVVRKNWYLVRALFGIRNKPAETYSKKANNKKNNEKEKQSDSENVIVESSDIDKSVS